LGTERECIKLVMELRYAGLKVDFEMSGKKLKKSLDFANKLGITYVIIIGEDEVNSGKVKIKKMVEGLEIEASLDTLVGTLKDMRIIKLTP